MISEEIKNIKSGKRELRSFAIVIASALLILALVLWWRDKPLYHYFYIPALIIFAIGFIAPVILKPIQKVWMTIAILLGWVMTRLILILFYYSIITIIGLVGRLLGQKFLDRKIDRNAESYWINRQRSDRTDCEKQF